MRQLDDFSKAVGTMECFNEMVACGVKNIALGIPVYDKSLRDEYFEYAVEMCSEEGTMCFKDDDALLTDLFPVSMNKDKYNIVFYREEKYLQEYLRLKERKRSLLTENRYEGEERRKIACDFGNLLSYPDSRIEEMINSNDDKETMKGIKVSSQISFLYFDDLPNAMKFFSEVMGFELACDQGSDYCAIYKVSKTSFIGAVDRKQGAVKATSRDGVLTSLVVDNADMVYKRLKAMNLNDLTEMHLSDRLKIKSMMFTGPEGYRFEVEEFLDENTRKFFYGDNSLQ